MAMAIRMPMMVTVTMTSISVNPRAFFTSISLALGEIKSNARRRHKWPTSGAIPRASGVPAAG
jgi:hypothetical protein